MKYSLFNYKELDENDCEFRINPYFIDGIKLSELEFESIRNASSFGDNPSGLFLYSISKFRFRKLVKLGIILKDHDSPYRAMYVVDKNFKRRLDEIAKEFKEINTMSKAKQWSIDNGYELLITYQTMNDVDKIMDVRKEARPI